MDLEDQIIKDQLDQLARIQGQAASTGEPLTPRQARRELRQNNRQEIDTALAAIPQQIPQIEGGTRSERRGVRQARRQERFATEVDILRQRQTERRQPIIEGEKGLIRSKVASFAEDLTQRKSEREQASRERKELPRSEREPVVGPALTKFFAGEKTGETQIDPLTGQEFAVREQSGSDKVAKFIASIPFEIVGTAGRTAIENERRVIEDRGEEAFGETRFERGLDAVGERLGQEDNFAPSIQKAFSSTKETFEDSPIAKPFETAIAPFVVGGLFASDYVPGLGSAKKVATNIAQETIEKLARETAEDVIQQTLKKEVPNASEQWIQTVSKELVEVDSVDEVTQSLFKKREELANDADLI